jgi:ribose transport system substrate-binding protein
VLPAEEQHRVDGYNLAAQAFVDNEGSLKLILLRDNEFGNTTRREQGVLDFVKECRAAGADCETVAQTNVLITNISTSVPRQVASVARQHPDWNALIAPYDAILTFVIPALKEAGVAGEGKRAYGFDPIDINVDWIRDGDVEAGTVASPYRWIAYAAVDQLNRAFAGEEPVDQGVKDKLVIKSNAPPKGETYLDDGDPGAAFRKIWGTEG